MLEGKDRFVRTYSNLHIPLRKGIIFVDESMGPISWEVAYTEVMAETPLGEKILDRLIRMKIV